MLTTDKKHLEIFNNTGRGIKINTNQYCMLMVIRN